MTTPSKAALRAELEAALANYRGPVKQCPAAPPPELVFEEELAPIDDDETDEDVVPRAVIAARGQGTQGNKTRRRGGEARGPKRIGAIAWQAAMNDWSERPTTRSMRTATSTNREVDEGWHENRSRHEKPGPGRLNGAVYLQHIFTAKSEVLGIRAKMDQLRREIAANPCEAREARNCR